MKDENKPNEDNNGTVVESTEALDALKVLVESKEGFDDSFLEEVSTIFAAGVDAAAKAKALELEKANEETQRAYEESFVEKIDAYLTYAAEQWVEQNELAVDTSIKAQISEDFLQGLKGLFEENYVDLPEGKVDLYEQAVEENESLNDRLDEAEAEAVQLKESLDAYTRKDIVEKVSEGMSDTQKERFEDLIESVEFETADQYESKLDILRKAFIDKDDIVNEDTKDGEDKIVVEDLSDGDDGTKNPLVERVLSALKS